MVLLHFKKVGMDMNLKALIILFTGTILSSCAGPMNPFGAVNPDLATSKQGVVRTPASYISKTQALINFSPSRQNWHQSTTFKTQIKDDHGIGSRAKVRFFFNKEEITEQVKANSSNKLSKDGKVLTYTINDFRLKLDNDNIITVTYQRDDHSAPLMKHYEEPRCPIDSVQKVKDHGPFKSQVTTFNKIEEIALQEGINPSLLAGLIAQESAFNPQAISWAKAIGLTQVTSLAEQHVIEKHPNWPRYKDLSSFSYPRVKSLILLGRINEENEWRLNKEMSIKGGIEYLRFVESYWSINSNKKIIEHVFPNKPEILEEVILASYNSGPFRVKKEIGRLGQHWLQSRHLGEAKKYVKKVKSYCYHFSNSGESYAPFTVSSL